MAESYTAAPAVPLRGARAAQLPLIGGRLCLDFANTANGRGTEHHTENLWDYPALLAWSRRAGAVDAAHAEALAEEARRHERAAESVRKQALVLREAIHRGFAALAHCRKPDPADLATINDGLAAALAHARLAPARAGFEWSWEEGKPALDRMLWPILRSAAELLTAAAELSRVKQCGGWDCGWLFLDLSKNSSRRWCEMEVCGSRAKARAYYARKRAAETHAE